MHLTRLYNLTALVLDKHLFLQVSLLFRSTLSEQRGKLQSQGHLSSHHLRHLHIFLLGSQLADTSLTNTGRWWAPHKTWSQTDLLLSLGLFPVSNLIPWPEGSSRCLEAVQSPHHYQCAPLVTQAAGKGTRMVSWLLPSSSSRVSLDPGHLLHFPQVFFSPVLVQP